MLDLNRFELSLSIREHVPVRYERASHYVREITGTIHLAEQLAGAPEKGTELEMGTFETRRVQLALAKEGGYSTSDILGSLDSELEEYRVLFNDSGDFREDLVQPADAGSRDLLVLHRVQIAEQWRGEDIGLLVAFRQVLTLSDGCGLVALKPFPVTPPETNLPEWQRPLRMGNPQYDSEQGTRNLGRYWGRFGFAEDRDGIWILDPRAMPISQEDFFAKIGTRAEG